MRVILQNDIKGVGRKNEVKDVSDGYARNYLFPRALAVPADSAGIEKLAFVKKKSDEKIEKLREAAHVMGKEKLLFVLAADEKGTPFGGVNKAMIEEALQKKGFLMDAVYRMEVRLSKPIKQQGDYRVEVKFPHGISSSILVSVRLPR